MSTPSRVRTLTLIVFLLVVVVVVVPLGVSLLLLLLLLGEVVGGGGGPVGVEIVSVRHFVPQVGQKRWVVAPWGGEVVVYV